MINLIACLDSKNGIGSNGTIPWSLPPDMTHFKETTIGTIVIMGRTTWESIGSIPLPLRTNVVITSSPHLIRGATSFTTFEKALQYFQDSNKQIFVIGGERLYREALPLADMIYITRIDKDYKCDTFFPYHLLLSHTYSSTPELQYRGLTYKFEIYYQ